ncbi:MAG: 2Fe-2S iron-sulfur cluster-binding protein [Gemmatimonadota bacterium]
MAEVTFLPAGATVAVAPGTYLTAAAARAGVGIVHDCDGQGVCGTCRVRIESGAEHLSARLPAERTQLGAALDAGWRLCCLVRVYGSCTVGLPAPGFAYPPDLQRDGPG